MKTAVFNSKGQVSAWFDEYLDAVNFCLKFGLLAEIKKESYVLKDGYSFRYLQD